MSAKKSNQPSIKMTVGGISFTIQAEEQYFDELKETERFANSLFPRLDSGPSSVEGRFTLFAKLLFHASDLYLAEKKALKEERKKHGEYRHQIVSSLEKFKRDLAASNGAFNHVVMPQHEDASYEAEEQSECEEETVVASSQRDKHTSTIRIFYEPDDPDGELEEYCYPTDFVDEKTNSFFHSD